MFAESLTELLWDFRDKVKDVRIQEGLVGAASG
jgi:hypothetical protein